MYAGIGDENDIDTGTVHLGMKLKTGMNQEMIFSDLIEDKKIYNFGIETFEPVTVEGNSNFTFVYNFMIAKQNKSWTRVGFFTVIY